MPLRTAYTANGTPYTVVEDPAPLKDYSVPLPPDPKLEADLKLMQSLVPNSVNIDSKGQGAQGLNETIEVVSGRAKQLAAYGKGPTPSIIRVQDGDDIYDTVDGKPNPKYPVRKVCTKCKRYFPKTRTYWHKRTASPDGLGIYCKECQREKQRKSNENQIARSTRFFTITVDKEEGYDKSLESVIEALKEIYDETPEPTK